MYGKQNRPPTYQPSRENDVRNRTPGASGDFIFSVLVFFSGVNLETLKFLIQTCPYYRTAQARLVVNGLQLNWNI